MNRHLSKENEDITFAWQMAGAYRGNGDYSHTSPNSRLLMQVGLPVLCIIGATNASKLLFSFLPSLFPETVTLCVQIILSILIYVALLSLTKTVTTEEKEFLSASLLPERIYNEKYRSSLLIVK
jgi:hypothetical protein